MATFKYVQGDTGPQLKVALTNETTSGVFDLSGATVTLHLRAAGETTVLFSRGVRRRDRGRYGCGRARNYFR